MHRDPCTTCQQGAVGPCRSLGLCGCFFAFGGCTLSRDAGGEGWASLYCAGVSVSVVPLSKRASGISSAFLSVRSRGVRAVPQFAHFALRVCCAGLVFVVSPRGFSVPRDRLPSLCVRVRVRVRVRVCGGVGMPQGSRRGRSGGELGERGYNRSHY